MDGRRLAACNLVATNETATWPGLITSRPEFAGNVIYVPTHDFVRKAEDSPNVGHGHHEFENAETYFLVGEALGKGMLKLLPTQKPDTK